MGVGCPFALPVEQEAGAAFLWSIRVRPCLDGVHGEGV